MAKHIDRIAELTAKVGSLTAELATKQGQIEYFESQIEYLKGRLNAEIQAREQTIHRSEKMLADCATAMAKMMNR